MTNAMKRFINTVLLFFIFTAVVAQVPEPVGPQTEPIALTGATAHIGNGQVVENAVIGFDKGVITFIEEGTANLDGYKVIDLAGQHIYPGFILPNTTLGLEEVSSIRAMSDDDEVGTIAPNVRALIAYNTDSKIPPTLRFNGILVAEPTPQGGRISGTSSVMNLEGWNWEDAALKTDVAIHMNWPRRVAREFDYATYSFERKPNKDYPKDIQEVKTFMDEAVAYGKLASKEVNLKLEAMQGLFSGDQILVIHVNDEREIVESVNIAKAAGVQRIAVVAEDEALAVSEFLAENKIPVILPPVHALPDSDDDDVYLPHKLPALLTKAGVKVALSHTGMVARSRNLPFYAGTAAAFGLSKEEALQLITKNPAEILGIDELVGTLEEGKRATFFVSKGDALDMMSNELSHAFIDGKHVVLDNEQQMLFKRYSDKYSDE